MPPRTGNFSRENGEETTHFAEHQSPNKPDFDVFAPAGCHLQHVVDGYV